MVYDAFNDGNHFVFTDQKLITSAESAHFMNLSYNAGDEVYDAEFSSSSVSWSMIDDSGLFEIDSSTGKVTLKADHVFDNGVEYDLIITARQNPGKYTSIKVTLRFDDPDFAAPPPSSAPESSGQQLVEAPNLLNEPLDSDVLPTEDTPPLEMV